MKYNTTCPKCKDSDAYIYKKSVTYDCDNCGATWDEKTYTKAEVDRMLNEILNGIITKKFAIPRLSNGIAQFVIDYLKDK